MGVRKMLSSCMQEAWTTFKAKKVSINDTSDEEFFQKVVVEIGFRSALSSTVYNVWQDKIQRDKSDILRKQLDAATLAHQNSKPAKDRLAKLMKKANDLVTSHFFNFIE